MDKAHGITIVRAASYISLDDCHASYFSTVLANAGFFDFMITFMRNFFKSKIGLGLTLAFLALIAFAFASSDVAGNAAFGGIAGGDRVAVIGGERIDSSEFSRTVGSAVDQVRRENPTITMQAFVEQGGLDEVLEQMIDQYAISAYAEKFGLRAGDNLINSEILTIGAFKGPDGNFSQDIYQTFLSQQRLTDLMVRQDLGAGLLAQQLISPSLASPNFPDKFAIRYAALLKERRQGAFAFLPSAVFAPEGDPTDAQLQAFFTDNSARYIRPERRTIRYASFGVESLDASLTPTQAEIAARYEQNRAQYAAREVRTFTQLIVPTKAAADSLRERIGGGESLETVARDAGFSTTSIGPIERADYATQASAGVAAAVFTASQGAIATPTQGTLGWHVVRIDDVETVAARSLASVSSEIAEQLEAEKRTAALADLSARVEEQVDGGTPLATVAQDLGITVTTTPTLTADGRVYGQQGRGVPPQLQPVLETAFQMEEGQPQLAEIVPGSTFLVFEVSEVTESATAPLDEIRDDVTVAWRLSEGSRLARAASDRVMERIADGSTLGAALEAEDATLPQPQPVDLNRQDLVTQQNQQIPPPLVLMFSMAEGTAKRLEAASDLGWFVVELDDISTDEIATDDPLVAAAQRQLQTTIAEEYRQQVTRAMRDELGVERNDAAVEAVRKRLLGES